MDWHAEAACFAFEYADSQEDINEIKLLIKGIQELDGMSFEDAKTLLKEAAYFAEGSLIYPTMKRKPYFRRLFVSQFLSADLLRRYIQPSFSD